MIFRWHLAQG